MCTRIHTFLTNTMHKYTIRKNNEYTHVATYGVQDVEISEGSLPNSICVTCIFAEGTAVRGCYIHLLQEHYSVTTNISSIWIGREGDILTAARCIDKLESDIYHVVVYDIEADGTVDWHNRALSITVSLNLTSSLDHVSTGKV